MAAKRFWIFCALAGLMAATGCRHWCERHYPCPAPGYPAAASPAAACVPCVPCCPPGATSYAPPPATANWSQPAGPRLGTCVCP